MKALRIGITKDNQFLYYWKGGKVWKTRRKQPGVPKGRPEVVAEADVPRDNNFMYYIDKDGDLACSRRAVGGQKRKKKAAPRKRKAKKGGKKGKKRR